VTKDNPAFQKPYSINPPNGKYMLWCPYCEWHMRDSNTARKRFGQHIGDRHPEEVRFLKGTRPPELVEEIVVEVKEAKNVDS